MAVGASLFIGAAWWLVNTIQENERLSINIKTLEQARLSDSVRIAFLKKDNAAKMVMVKRRTKLIISLNNKLLKAKSDIKVITKTVVTEIERECLNAPVPVAIVDFMLDKRPADNPEGDS